MAKLLEALRNFPFWLVGLILGVLLIAAPCVTFGKEVLFSTHPPTDWLLPSVGGFLVLLSIGAYFAPLLVVPDQLADVVPGVDFTTVHEENGDLYTIVNECQIRVAFGRIQDYARGPGTAVALPCNEYFDDRCVDDPRSALGSYVGAVFKGQRDAFVELLAMESLRRLGPGMEQQKTEDVKALSFGAGRCLLLLNPLARATPVALVSTTTQRVGEGLSARIAYLFEGTQELSKRLADARINEVVMPVLGSGHGGLDGSLALVGLLLALSEAAKYGRGAQRLKKATVVRFVAAGQSATERERTLARRVLALIGSAHN